MFGPVLKGAKVVLRPPDASDPARFIAWLADPEVTRYLGVRFPLSLLAEEETIKRMGDDRNTVWWVVEAEGRAIGGTGIHQIDWVDRNGTTGTVIGDKAAWRKGYGSEAMLMRTEYAFRQLDLHKLKSSAFMENEPSKHALAKAGYRQIGVQREDIWRDGKWHDHWLCEVLRSDWEREHPS